MGRFRTLIRFDCNSARSTANARFEIEGNHARSCTDGPLGKISACSPQGVSDMLARDRVSTHIIQSTVVAFQNDRKHRSSILQTTVDFWDACRVCQSNGTFDFPKFLNPVSSGKFSIAVKSCTCGNNRLGRKISLCRDNHCDTGVISAFI